MAETVSTNEAVALASDANVEESTSGEVSTKEETKQEEYENEAEVDEEMSESTQETVTSIDGWDEFWD